MKKILSTLFLACSIAAMPLVYAADEAPADQKKDQKTAGENKENKENKEKKAVEEGKKKTGEKKEGSDEPECN